MRSHSELQGLGLWSKDLVMGVGHNRYFTDDPTSVFYVLIFEEDSFSIKPRNESRCMEGKS